MKPIIIATALALSMAASVQAMPGSNHATRAEAHHQKRLENLTGKLNLTDAQQLQIKALLDEQRAAHGELFQRHRAEQRSLREAHEAELDAILSTDQKVALNELRAERRQRFEHGKQRSGRHRHGGKHHWTPEAD